MEELSALLAYFGMNLKGVVAGLAGGTLSLWFEKGLTFLKAVALVATGGIAAAYLGPLVASWLDLQDQGEAIINFITGLCSMKVLKGVMLLTDIKINKSNGNGNSTTN